MAEQDFLQPLLDAIQENARRQDRRMDTLEGKLDTNTAISQQALDQARYTNGRVTRLEGQAGTKINFQPRVVYFVAVGAVILLLIIASLLHINIGGLLP